MSSATGRQADYDYVVVGSGAGGGTLAARLAEEGQRVILLEAGGDPRELSGDDPAYPGEDRARDDYDVPVFHAFASENEAYRWDHFVRHYESDAQQERDEKYRKEWCGKPVDGVLYPRSGTLGGCTAHNAQIFVYPHNDDWNGIAELTRDPSWRAEAMHAHFERLENCHHRPLMRFLRLLGYNPTRHGWRGWLRIEKALPEEVIGDKKLIATIFKSVYEAFKNLGQKADRIRWFLEGRADPNDWRLVRDNATGIRYPPLTHHKHQRMGTRERLLDVARRHPDRLRIELDALATRVLFDENQRAIGVEYRKGARLYRACAKPSAQEGEKREVYAGREVILAGGAFNTPQLLMLSGVGPREVLERFEIPVVVELPGVGQNLQDRYEVGVVNRMGFKEWEVLKGAKFAKGDPQYAEWSRRRKGVYATNGAVLAVIKKSAQARLLPDLFCFALLGPFKGYFPGYSALYPKNLNCLTWAIVKAHTNNRRGEVTLRSNDPLDTPLVNFRYFEEGSEGWEEDLDSVVDGIEFVRELTAPLKEKGIIAAEEVPGDAVQGEALRTFVRDQAWGHHASCSCAIGPREEGGVLSSDFKVHGTQGLRVVDASVFPRIPGFFIVSAIYMIAEKAAAVILAEHGRK